MRGINVGRDFVAAGLAPRQPPTVGTGSEVGGGEGEKRLGEAGDALGLQVCLRLEDEEGSSMEAS
jgi:hypothetical protein